MLKHILPIILIIKFAFQIVAAQELMINEVMSSNNSTLTDEDGDSPDWIELYNASSSAINLIDHSLSDDPQEPDKWIFHAKVIPPNDHLLIFASGKDRREVINHWETVVDYWDQWRYHYGSAQTPANWYTDEFDEIAAADWKDGISGFGYGDDDDVTIVIPTLSIYIKKRFVVNDISKIIKIVLHVDYDDAFVAYLNGIEIARKNIGTPGIPPAYNDVADHGHEAVIYQGRQPDMFTIENVLTTGENVLAVQVHNININSSDLTLIPFLSLGMLEPPSDAKGSSQFLYLYL